MAYYTAVYGNFPDDWKENLIFRNEIQDYGDAKHHNFYFEYETIN